MPDLELTVSWTEDGRPSAVRFTPRGWQLHLPAELVKDAAASVIAYADLDEAAHALVAWHLAHEPSTVNRVCVTGPGVPVPRPWGTIAALVAEVAARMPGPAEQAPTVRSGPSRPRVVDTNPIVVKTNELLAVLTAMRTRPFVLLAGVSGSGKTQLAKRLGKAWAQGWIDEKKKPDEVLAALTETYRFVTGTGDWRAVHDLAAAGPGEAVAVWEDHYAFTSVQSDWTDASHLWGYHVPLPESAAGFYGTKALRTFLSAWRDDSPHVVLLDEMNLSRPEHYGSDLLSAMEVKSRDGERGEPVIELHRAGGDLALRGEAAGSNVVPQRIGWGRRLLVIGTVNVDETTFAFAPKVLDRAALLEFTEVSLGYVFSQPGALPTHLAQVWNPKDGLVQRWFADLHALCSPYNLHLGYRAAKEILEVMALRGTSVDVRDAQLRNKVLPRVRGPRAAVTPILLRLLHFAATGSPPSESWVNEHQHAEVEELRSELSGETYPESKAKALEMLRRAQTVGFTSYFG